ncbi:energy transducer TonB [Flavobacterium undicola]|uniref:energy transducer TonB n=1 Tax=Flavobacterium undicola TaxID=1932779 RepID=UPI0013782158|nr:energy transducer TonB [Flavobacterium undicola]MBA0882120.1 energy transducer TonB [Flavobacterium undicola]
MKKIFLLFFIVFTSISFGQSKKDSLSTTKINIINSFEEYIANNNDKNKIYSSAEVDTRPELIGWIKKEQFIKDNFRTPVVNGEKIEGKVYVSFVIEKDGSISNIGIIRDVGHGTKEEAIRVLQNMPRWNPAKKDGITVRCSFTMPMILP